MKWPIGQVMAISTKCPVVPLFISRWHRLLSHLLHSGPNAVLASFLGRRRKHWEFQPLNLLETSPCDTFEIAIHSCSRLNRSSDLPFPSLSPLLRSGTWTT